MDLPLGKNKLLRGQLFSTELTVSLSIFLAGVVLYLFVWNTLYNNYVEEQADIKIQVALIGISDAAVLSPLPRSTSHGRHRSRTEPMDAAETGHRNAHRDGDHGVVVPSCAILQEGIEQFIPHEYLQYLPHQHLRRHIPFRSGITEFLYP